MDVKGSLQMANTAKTAIVTGASRGIGAGLVEAFLKRGYSVVANSRNIIKANPYAAAANVALVDGDIGDPRTAAEIVDTAVSRFGRTLVEMDVPTRQSYVAALVRPTERAFASGVTNLARNLFWAVGSGVAGVTMQALSF
jgi:NAD(P)-dependent dehydrogenase (short-subunit alcohol dehydrogenase family)